MVITFFVILKARMQ